MKSILFILLSSIILSSCYSQDTILKDYVREPFHTRPMPKAPTIPYNKDSVFIKMWCEIPYETPNLLYTVLYMKNNQLYMSNIFFDFDVYSFDTILTKYCAKIDIDSTKYPYEVNIIENGNLYENFYYIKNDTLIVSEIKIEEVENGNRSWAHYCIPIDSFLHPLVEINIAMCKAYDADSNTIGRWYNHNQRGVELDLTRIELIRNENGFYIDSINQKCRTQLSKDISGKILLSKTEKYPELGIAKINNESALEVKFGSEIIKFNFMPFDKYYYRDVLKNLYYKTDTKITSKYYKTP